VITALAGIVTAIAVLIGALNQIGFFKSSSNSNSSSTASPTRAEPERIMSYWLTVQKCPQGKACEQPFQLSDATATYIFEENYRVRLNVTTPQPGYFYVLNESLERVAGDPRYVILYPSTTDRQDAASLEMTVPQNDWFKFDNKKGTEKLWVVWSERPLAELEVVKGLANSKDEGKIKDVTQNRAIDDLLTRYSAARSGVEKDDDKNQTKIRAKGGVIVYPISLEHR
jgi:hypothetical protein